MTRLESVAVGLKDWLRETSLGVAEIATACGYRQIGRRWAVSGLKNQFLAALGNIWRKKKEPDRLVRLSDVVPR